MRALSSFEAYCGSGSLTRALHVNHGVKGLLLDTDPAKLQWDPEVLKLPKLTEAHMAALQYQLAEPDPDQNGEYSYVPKGAGRRFIRSNPDLPLLALDVSRSGALTPA